MIVISGALVLVALILLIIGVVGPELSFVYASIAVSLVSLGFLVVGILQRRGETPAAGEAAAAPEAQPADTGDSVTAVIPRQGTATSRKLTEEPPAAETADEETAAEGTVLVVEGRPRYHVEGCRYLSGKAAEEVDLDEAREEGFTPCGVCKPDEVLAAQAAPALSLSKEPGTDEQVEEPVVEEDVPGVKVPAPARRTAPRAVAKAPAKAARKAPAKAAGATSSAAGGPAIARKAAPAETLPAAGGQAASRTTAVKAPAKAVKAAAPSKALAKAPSKAAAAAAASAPAAAKRAGSVVVIPDRGKFHKSECRFVRGVDGTEVLSKTAATRQGYAACGVCKP